MTIDFIMEYVSNISILMKTGTYVCSYVFQDVHMKVSIIARHRPGGAGKA